MPSSEFNDLLEHSEYRLSEKKPTTTRVSITTNMSAETRTEIFNKIYVHTLSFRPPLLRPPKTKDTSLTDCISSLRLHPALEAGLHILNYDLASAHFLVRKMQSLPAQEGMFLHGVLHRIEGDYPNARACYSDLSDTEIMERVWGKRGEGVEGGKACEFIDDVQKLDEKGKKGEKGVEVEEEQERLGKESKREIVGIIEYCIENIGVGEWGDARIAYVKSGKKIKAETDQITGTAQRREVRNLLV